MTEPIEINSLEHEGIDIFSSLTDHQLRSKADPSKGLIIVESPKVIAVAMDAGYEPLALLCERRHIAGDASGLIERHPEMKVYTGSREVLASLTGYTLTRGVLCAMRRPAQRQLTDICTPESRRIAVIDGVTDTTNIGAIFRSAAALGIDGIVLTPTSCDPFNRRSIRVSMGSVFLVPWTWLEGDIQELGKLGFKTVAMALTDNSVSISDSRLNAEPRLAIVLGTEGDGLANHVIEGADYVARIPMSHGVDSLNVAAASAVAFYQLATDK